MPQPFFYIHEIWTKEQQFFGHSSPQQLIEKYGSPLYVYNETVLRTICRELKNLVSYPLFNINYSAKANTNLRILQIVKEEGFSVDAMSPGELYLEKTSGFKSEDILFIPNNVSDEEFKYAIKEGVLVSVDSISQLERYGRLNRGGNVVVRINPGVGAGHHEKVVTGGKKTKFGVDPALINELRSTLQQYDLKLVGLNQHIGSLFMTSEKYVEAASFMLSFAENFPQVEFVDFGGGFGVPYHKESGEQRLDLSALGAQLQQLIDDWVQKTGRKIKIKIEPGRYTVAECGVLLGQVHTIKENGGKTYIGTDIGFNILARPMIYGSYHDIEVYSDKSREKTLPKPFTIVGNICETGDVLAKDRLLPDVKEGDILGILNAGAYGMVMASNYNCRLRPAEVLITTAGEDLLIKKRETFEDLIRHFTK